MSTLRKWCSSISFFRLSKISFAYLFNPIGDCWKVDGYYYKALLTVKCQARQCTSSRVCWHFTTWHPWNSQWAFPISKPVKSIMQTQHKRVSFFVRFTAFAKILRHVCMCLCARVIIIKKNTVLLIPSSRLSYCLCHFHNYANRGWLNSQELTNMKMLQNPDRI